MTWLSLLASLAKLAGEFIGWLRERALLSAGEIKGRAESDADHARAAAEQGERMQAIAASKPTREQSEKRLEEGNA
jgi:hypothetical protein